MIINGNALSIPLASNSVHCVVTSPPYWSLRDYGVPGQLGLEATPEEYVANMVAVFREVWRVLRDDGTLWLNLGDSYNGSGGAGGDYNAGGLKDGQPRYPGRNNNGLKPKDLVGIPWRVAFALQADGWYLRSDIIWSKPNPMPESVTDRPTKAHEYLFLLAKRRRYFWDAEAVREEAEYGWSQKPGMYERIGINTKRTNYGESINGDGGTRNIRTVWEIATQPYKGAHFATFPTALVEPCIKAGTSERGVCPKCGKPWVRVVERGEKQSIDGYKRNAPQITDESQRMVAGIEKWNRNTPMESSMYYPTQTTGWRPDCNCDAGDPIPALVFDPFAGSGTTVMVAYDLGRRGVGLDLSLDYLDAQARSRIHNGHTGRLL